MGQGAARRIPRRPFTFPGWAGSTWRAGQPIARVGQQVLSDAVGARDGLSEEGDGLLEAVVRFGTTEAQEPLSRRTEALTTQARHAEAVIGCLQQGHRQAVRG